MLRISESAKLTDYITDQGFTRVTAKTMDDTQVMNVVHANSKELAEGLIGWLNRFNGVYILHFRQKDNSPVYFGVKWEPDQTGTGAVLNGTGADIGTIKAEIMAQLKADQERQEERDELERLKTINGQLGLLAQTVLPAILNKFFPQNMAGPAANLQGITPDTLPDEQQQILEVAVNRLLQQVSPAFLNSLANYVENNPAIVPTVAAMIGHQEPQPQPQTQPNE